MDILDSVPVLVTQDFLVNPGTQDSVQPLGIQGTQGSHPLLGTLGLVDFLGLAEGLDIPGSVDFQVSRVLLDSADIQVNRGILDFRVAEYLDTPGSAGCLVIRVSAVYLDTAVFVDCRDIRGSQERADTLATLDLGS